jgi:hypothetical protein
LGRLQVAKNFLLKKCSIFFLTEKDDEKEASFGDQAPPGINKSSEWPPVSVSEQKEKQKTRSGETRVARFFLVNIAQTGKNVPNQQKMYQINTKCTKLTQNVPNGHKMYQMVIKYPKWP